MSFVFTAPIYYTINMISLTKFRLIRTKAAVLLLCLFWGDIYSIEYRVAVESVLDNKEYGHYPAADGTLFFVRNETEIGIRVDEDRNHQI
ncbi:MAG: hypothetical protein FWE57_09975, partial [Chitinispirillia bacterium]|nr:hypothetical protein [Chitinispirillia bacterium]